MLGALAAAWRLPATKQIGSDQLCALVRAAPAGLVCGVLNSAIVAASFWSAVSRTALFAWLIPTLIVTAAINLRRPAGPAREKATLSRRAVRKASLAAFLSALPWGVLPAIYLGQLPHSAELVLITVCAGMAAGGSVLLAPVYVAAFVYVGTVLVPFTAKCFLMAEAGYGLLGLLALSYASFLFAIIATTARLSVEHSEALRELTRSAHQLKERDEIISVQNLRFESALNNMTQGLSFFDGQERLIVCNKRYLEMYGLDPRRVQPGISLSEIIDMRYESGACPKISRQEYLAWRRQVGAADRPSETVHELKDGRVYAVHYQPMAHGAWVATTDDITERQRLSDQLAANHKLLTDRTALLQAIIDDFPGGIGYYDKDLRVALCNDKAKAMLDLPERLFANGPPRLEELLRFNVERGIYGPGEVEQLVADKLALVTGRKSYHSERVQPNGTVLEVTGTPVVGGGYITTYMDITERYRAEAKIAHMATHDSLTDLPNRVLFSERLDKAVAEARKGKGDIAVLLMDLNKFKAVNDTLGHPVGDSLLKAVAERLTSCVRGDDLVARLGGDEFAIVVHTFDAATEAALIAARVQAALSVPFELGQHQVEIGVSVGISVSSADDADAEQLIHQADAALYRAKAEGGGRYQFFGAEMDQQDLPKPVASVRRAAGAAH